MELLKVDTLDEAILKLYNEYINNGGYIYKEVININLALDRILACDIISNTDVPEFDRTVVDGYAVIAKDTQGANESIPTFLNVVGESLMGKPCDIELKSGDCVYVPTGAMLPKNSDACVMVEHTENITNDKIAICESVASGKNVVKKGDDIKSGNLVFKSGRKLSAADIGLLSSIGIYQVEVFKKWNISIISTGDELIDENEEYKFGNVRDINSNLLSALSYKYNINVINRILLKDDKEVLESKISEFMKNSDVVILSGGSSKGKKDASSFVIDKITSSKVLTHGIAIKPGKPTITSFDKNTNTLVIGLPGHPVASAILFKLIAVDLYYKITNCKFKNYVCEGIMSENIPSSPGRMTFILANIDEKFNVTPIYGRSGLIHTLSSADGYIVLDINQEGIKKGDKVIFNYL